MDLTGDDILINYYEVALDLETETTAHAGILKRWFRQRLIKSHHSTNRLHDYKRSTYFAPRDSDTNIVLYTRSSKLFADIPCLRIEFRFRGNKAVRRSGIRTLRDLIEFDHLAFWDENIRLRDIDFQQYGKFHYYKARVKVPNRRQPVTKKFANGRIEMNVWRRLGYALAYRKIWDSVQHEFEFTAQEFYDYCKIEKRRKSTGFFDDDVSTEPKFDTQKMRSCIKVIDNSVFLPV